MQVVLDLESEPASFRKAWDMRRACKPTVVSPISPSISARGTKAATESTTTQSIAPERTSMSHISSACSPVSGCEMRTLVNIDPEAGGINRIEGVLGVDERDDTSHRLRLRDDLVVQAWSYRLTQGRRSPRSYREGRLLCRAQHPKEALRSVMTPIARSAPPSPSFIIDPRPNFDSI